MSSVTDMFVIVGDSEDGPAEHIAPKVAQAIAEVGDGRLDGLPVIDLNHPDWSSLQGGGKVAGSAVLWFGWNYAYPDELVAHLRAKGFKHITVWSHHEFSDDAPVVVSW